MSNIAIIEWQTPGGSWQRVCDCANNSATIKLIMEANFKANPRYHKLRAIDGQTKQLIDISFRS